MLRSFALALGAIVALAAAQPAEAARNRAEARTAGKAPRAAAPARLSARPAAAVSRRPVAMAPIGRTRAEPARASASRGDRFAAWQAPAARGGRLQARSAGRREAYRAADRREVYRSAGRREVFRDDRRQGSRHAFVRMPSRQMALHGGRSGLRMVGLFSSPAAAATLPPMRGGKYGKAYGRSSEGGGERRGGAWHAGLPSADGEQMDCPSGTMAVLARGHADTFRCMPM